MTQPPAPQRPTPTSNPYDGTPPPSAAWPHPQPFAPYAAAMPEHPQSATVLVLGLIGLFIPVTGPIAWWMGSRARAEVAAGRYAPGGTLTGGWVLGIITTLWLAVVILLFALAFVGLLAFRSA